MSENELSSDYSFNQIQSFSFAKAQEIAYRRIQGLDDLKSVVDQALDGERFEDYVDLRYEILDSCNIEEDYDVIKEVSKEDAKRHNSAALASMENIIKGRR